MITNREQPLGVFELLEGIIVLSSALEPLIQQYRSAVSELAVGNASSFVTLRVADLERAVRRFLEGQLSAHELSRWANLLEGNDLVEYDETANRLIADVLFQLASPEINGPITKQACEELLARLGCAEAGDGA